MNKKFCIYCGTELLPEALFCSHCGKRQEMAASVAEPVAEAQTVVEEATPAAITVEAVTEQPVAAPEKKPRKKLPVVSFIRNALILMLAIVMTVAAFVPFSTIEVSSDDMDIGMTGVEFDVELEFTAIDNVVLFFDSLKQISEEELVDTKLYEKIEEKAEEFAELVVDNKVNDFDDLDGRAEEIFYDIIYLSVRLAMQSDMAKTPVAYSTQAILSLLYILVALAFLVFAILNFICTFGLMKRAQEPMYKWTLAMLSAIPALITSLAYALFASFTSEVEMSDMTVTALILSLSVLVVVFVLRLVFGKKDGKLRPVARAIAMGLAITVICVALAPVAVSTVKTEFNGSTKAKEADIWVDYSSLTDFTIPDPTMEDIEEVRDEYTAAGKTAYYEQLFSSFARLSKLKAEDTAGELLNSALLVSLVATKTNESVPATIALAPLFAILTVIGAAIVLWQNTLYFVSGKYSRATVIASKIASAAFAVITLVIAIILVAIASSVAEKYMTSDYTVKISAGIIALVTVAVGSVFCPARLEPKPKRESAPAEPTEEAEQIF